MSYNYDDYVTAFSKNFIRISIDKEYYDKIDKFVDELIQRKAIEEHHIQDGFNEKKRFMTGFLGEAAIEKLFGLKIIDWGIGSSSYYHHPDIPGYLVGIKTVEKGKFPIIFKENNYPQILCIRSTSYCNVIYVCGLATTDVLKKYQDPSLILDPKLRRRGTKTGFYGYKYLLPVKSLEDIEKYKKY